MPKQKMLVIDPQIAGVAGDMFVAALLNLGAKVQPVVSAMEKVAQYVPDCQGIKVTPKQVHRCHIGGLYLDIRIDETFKTRTGGTLLTIIAEMTKDLKLTPFATAFASRAIRILVEAEAAVHQQTPKKVHLHAAGSADTIIDIIGAAKAFDELNLTKAQTTGYFVLPIAVGGGTFTSSHGQLAAPGPAVTKILTDAKLLFKGGPVEQELTTPTGAALIAALSPTPTQVYPTLRPMAVGYGAGTVELPGIPNLLRLVLGEPPVQPRFSQDQVMVLETNVDDVSGETLGYIIEQLMTAGAKDVTILPTTTKKNRPGHIISVIAAPEDELNLTHILIRESGSLGVRVLRCDRHLLVRKIYPVRIKLGKHEVKIRVKIASDLSESFHQIKAEYEDIRKVAQTTGYPLFKIAQKAEAKARQELTKKGGRKPRHRSITKRQKKTQK